MSAHVDERRRRAADAWRLDEEIVLIGAGRPIGIPGGADQVLPFHAHPDHRWLAGRGDAGAVVAFDPRSGWSLFTPRPSEEERLWEGTTTAPTGPDLDDLASWLGQRSGRPTITLGAPPWPNGSSTSSRDRGAELEEALHRVRRVKDEDEISAIRGAVSATAAGFAQAAAVISPGVTDRHVRIELEAAMFHAGADRTGYETVVGVGPTSAVLHAHPSGQVIGERDIVLIDAGAEIDGYCADVTRVYFGGGAWRGPMATLRDVVAEAQRVAVERCLPGVEWRDVHRAAAFEIAVGLIDMGVLRSPAGDRLEDGSVGLFFPHGIGHMVGLGVRDAGGALPGRQPAPCCGASLRLDMPLEPGFVVTVEPGAYLIPGLLRDSARRDEYRDAVDWTRVDALLHEVAGGIRIEDDVLVSDSAPEILTAAIPGGATG